MSISPVSDIVFDVARAADPAGSAAATARLARLSGTEPASAAAFTMLADEKPPVPMASHTGTDAITGARAPTTRRREARTEAIEGLEGLLLQKLVESMLPKETSTLFGHGTAGDVWRSMLADQLATQIGSVVDLGVGRAVPALAPPTRSDVVADGRDAIHRSNRLSFDRGT